MQKKSPALEVLKFLGMLIISWLLWVFVVAALVQEDEIPQIWGMVAFVMAVLTAFAVSFILSYNAVRGKQQIIKRTQSNIAVFEERRESLLDKANRVTDKYMAHERGTLTSVTHERGGQVPMILQSADQPVVRSAGEFRGVIESYPELKANENIMKLLQQIQDCEDTVASSKIIYNANVAEYNYAITSFPMAIFRGLMKFTEHEYYKESVPEEEITDEMLGL